MNQRKKAILQYEARTGQLLTHERRCFNAKLRSRRLHAGGVPLAIDTQLPETRVDFDDETLRMLLDMGYPSRRVPRWPAPPIGHGASSAVYRVSRKFAKQTFPTAAWMTSNNKRPPWLAVKHVTVQGELRQLFGWAQELRTRQNIRQHLQHWSQRCEHIYQPLARHAAEWGLAQFVAIPHACAFLQSEGGVESVPSLVLAMDLVKGDTLETMLRGASERDALLVLLQGLSVLSMLWQHGIYHNDFHTRNLMVADKRVDSCTLHFPTHRIELSGGAIPLLRVIDFDLATTLAPRDGNYATTDMTGALPFLDAAFLYSTMHAVTGPLPVEAAFTRMVHPALRSVGQWRHSDIVPVAVADQQMWSDAVTAVRTALGADATQVDPP